MMQHPDERDQLTNLDDRDLEQIAAGKFADYDDYGPDYYDTWVWDAGLGIFVRRRRFNHVDHRGHKVGSTRSFSTSHSSSGVSRSSSHSSGSHSSGSHGGGGHGGGGHR
jgi:hypothetical protein